MKEIIGKVKIGTNQLPKQLNYKNNSDKHKIAESFNDFFVSVGKNLASKIPNANRDFNSYLSRCETDLPSEDLTFDELQIAFQSLLPNKSPGLDEISVNVVKIVYDVIEPLLFRIFSLSLKTGIWWIWCMPAGCGM